jgi:signal transduction histidine kinase
MINATVSHELRNPLNSIISQNLEKEALHEELRVYLELMKQAERYSDEVDKSLLVLKKLESGQ